MIVEITELDLEKMKLVGKDDFDTSFTFSLERTTKVIQLTPVKINRELGPMMDRNSATPFKVGAQVMIHWKADTEAKKRIALAVSTFK